jgi:hypothetical protein
MYSNIMGEGGGRSLSPWITWGRVSVVGEGVYPPHHSPRPALMGGSVKEGTSAGSSIFLWGFEKYGIEGQTLDRFSMGIFPSSSILHGVLLGLAGCSAALSQTKCVCVLCVCVCGKYPLFALFFFFSETADLF